MSGNNKGLVLFGFFLSAFLLWQVPPGRANPIHTAENQLNFPIHYKGEGISTEAILDHYLFGDLICTSTATWEITLNANGTLFGSYLNTDPKAASGEECVSVYDQDHPSGGVNQITFSGEHSNGFFEITKSNLYYDYTNTKFRGHDKNIQGYYDADHIYTSPAYRYESSTYANWTDMFGHEFDLPRVGGGSAPADPEPDEGILEEAQPEAGVVAGPGQDDGRDEDSSGINPLLPVAGIGAASAAAAAAAGGAAAAVASRGNNRSRKKPADQREQKKNDPCAEELDRLREASAQARALHDGIQTLRSYLAVLDTMYENVRQAAYWDASIDLGLFGASIFTGPLSTALTGRAVVQGTIGKAMAESAAKSLGAEMMKNITRGMLEQGISWESLAKAPYGGAEGVVLEEVISDLLTQRYQKRLIQQGTTRTVQKALVKGYSKQVASHLASAAGKLISLGKIGSGAYTAAKKLEVIRQEISEMSKTLLEMELRYDDLLSEMRLSRSVYQKCRQTWPVQGLKR
jgi:hypothetical protein